MKIDRLEPSKHKLGRYLAFLEDGSLIKVSEGEELRFALHPGLELEEDVLAQLRASASDSMVRSKAAELISRRPMSRKELVGKLKEKGAAPAEAEGAADWLEELGALDEEEVARMVVRHYSAMGYGPQKFRQELSRRGVPREYWEAAMEEAEDPADFIQRFLAKKLGGPTEDRRALKRAADGLARRGFSWSDIRAGLSRYAELTEDMD